MRWSLLALALTACHAPAPAEPPRARPEADPLAQACLAGDHGRSGTYCSSAALFYELGDPAQQDLPRAEELWTRACATHEPHPSGPEWPCLGAIRVACKQGSAEQCMELGRRQLSGSGGAGRDPKAARRSFASACDAGSADGCTQATELSPSSAPPRSPPAAP